MNPHHVIPPPPPAGAGLVEVARNETGRGGGAVLGAPLDVPLGVVGEVLLVVGVAVGLAVAALLAAGLGGWGRPRPLAGRGRLEPGGSPGGAAGRLGRYAYEGGRAGLRRVYEALLARLEETGVAVGPHMTISELARAAVAAGLLDEARAGRLVGLYSLYMYGPLEPGPGVVEEAARLAGVSGV